MDRELGIYPQEGIDIFSIIISDTNPQTVVSVDNLHSFLESADTHKQKIASQQSLGLQEYDRPSLNTPFVAPQTEMQKNLCVIYTSVLGIRDIGIDDNYFELGGDSLLAIQIIYKINDTFHLDLPIREFFAYRTVRQLAEYLDGKKQEGEAAAVEKGTPETHMQTSSLAPVQKKLWILDRLVGSEAYNFSVAVQFQGAIDIALLEKAVQYIVSQHDALRMSVQFNGQEPQLVILQDVKVTLDTIPCTYDIQQYLFNFMNQKIPLEEAPLFRLNLVTDGQGGYIFVFVIHHIVFDGWSKTQFFNQLIKCYKELQNGTLLPRDPAACQYSEYAQRANALRETQEFTIQREYWTKLLMDAPAQSTIPSDYIQPAMQSFEGEKYYISLGATVTDQITVYSKKMQCSPYTILMAAHLLMIHKYTGQETVCVGSPVSGRRAQDMGQAIGLFANTVVVKMDIDPEMYTGDFVHAVNMRILEALEYQDITLNEILDAMQYRGDKSQNPLFQSMLIYHNMQEPEVQIQDVTYDNLEIDTKTSKFDFTLEFYQSDEKGLHGWIEYSNRLYRLESVEFLWLHYLTILQNLVNSTGETVRQLSMCHERDRALQKQEKHGFELLESIIPVFRKTVQTCFEQPALYFENEVWSFGQLGKAVDKLAGYLQNQFPGPGERILVYMDRSPYSIIALLGIWQAGHVYVPIDCRQPEQFMNEIYEKAGCSAVLYHVPQSGGMKKVMNFIDINAVLCAPDCPFHLCEKAYSDPETLIYILYTSGSTAQPKGIMGLQRGVMARSQWMWNQYPYDCDECCCHKTSIGFIDALNEIVTPLLKGVPLLVLPQDTVYNLNEFASAVSRKGVTRITLIPSLLTALLDYCPDLEKQWKKMRQIIISGEVAQHTAAAKCKRQLPHVSLMNIYGCTECSGDSALYDIGALTLEEVSISSDQEAGRPPRIVSSIPIGRPMTGVCDMLVADGEGAALPVGSIGEILIGGNGVNHGYWDNAEATSQVFIRKDDGTQWYKTGDMGRLLATGDLEYIGRKDRIYKRNGIRIDLAQIEATVLSYTGIQKAVILPNKTEEGQDTLVCYFESNLTDFNVEGLKRHLKEIHQEFYLPSLYLRVEKIPQLMNGKVNEKELGAFYPSLSIRQECGVQSELERKLALFWRKAIHIENLDIPADTPLFDVGGNSLTAIQLLTYVQNEYGVEIPFSVFLKNASLRQMAQEIDRRLQGEYS